MNPGRILSAALLALGSITAFAQAPAAPTTAVQGAQATAQPAAQAAQETSTPAGGHALTAEDVNTWLDGLMPNALKVDNIPGAVVVVVANGQILTERGFGYSDVAKRKPVDPKLTLFRPGSVSKLFTWTAVMQQVEQGRINLDADVNKYLDFRIPPYDGKPVTMRELMQHTAGFEEQVKGILSHSPDSPRFVALLKRWVPTRIFAPGTTPAYSNYGASLAGYIVQRVSGEPFDTYIEKHIFEPLDMRHSTFRQPLPKNLAPLLSKGYMPDSVKPGKFEFVGPAPAGALSSTGEDMAHFMIAHLQDGEYNGKRILSQAIAEQMHNSPLTVIPTLPRMELGFYESNINGHEVIGHGGDTQLFHSTLHLFLKQDVGLYASFNSPGRKGAVQHLRSDLFTEFADRYFPGPRVDTRVDAATATRHARMLAGHWVASRRSETNFLSLVAFMGQTKVEVGPKGGLVVPDFKGSNGVPIKWVETAPFVWNNPMGHERLAAKLVDGKPVRFSIDMESPFTVFDRPPFYKDGAWLMPSLSVALGALALTALFWPITAIVRRRYGARLELTGTQRSAFRLSKVAAWAIVLAFLAWITSVTMMFNDFDKLSATFDPVIRFDQVFGFIAFIGGLLLMLWNLWVVWTHPRRWPARLWSIVLVLSSAAVLWVALAFHLISWGVNY